MLNQAICINGLVNHLIHPMQCGLNGAHISEVPKFLAENLNETTHAIEFVNPFNVAHYWIIPVQLSGTSYFDVYSSSAAEYENDDIQKIHLTAEEPPWDPSMKGMKSEKERLK